MSNLRRTMSESGQAALSSFEDDVAVESGDESVEEEEQGNAADAGLGPMLDGFDDLILSQQDAEAPDFYPAGGLAASASGSSIASAPENGMNGIFRAPVESWPQFDAQCIFFIFLPNASSCCRLV